MAHTRPFSSCRVVDKCIASASRCAYSKRWGYSWSGEMDPTISCMSLEVVVALVFISTGRFLFLPLIKSVARVESTTTKQEVEKTLFNNGEVVRWSHAKF